MTILPLLCAFRCCLLAHSVNIAYSISLIRGLSRLSFRTILLESTSRPPAKSIAGGVSAHTPKPLSPGSLVWRRAAPSATRTRRTHEIEALLSGPAGNVRQVAGEIIGSSNRAYYRSLKYDELLETLLQSMSKLREHRCA